jgi:hypothetical protein
MDLSNMDLSGLLSTFGIGGALVWYLYYNTSVTLPALHEHYSKVLTEMGKEFTAALKEERDASAREFAAFRESAKEGRCFYQVEQKRIGGNGQA